MLNLAAFGIWYWSFIKDSVTIHTEGYTDVNYSWITFFIGLLLGIAGIVYSYICSQTDSSNL